MIASSEPSSQLMSTYAVAMVKLQGHVYQLSYWENYLSDNFKMVFQIFGGTGMKDNLIILNSSQFLKLFEVSFVQV